MKVALIGASGFVGQLLLKELLNRGHHVNALVHQNKNLAASDNLNVVKGDVNDEAAFVDFLKGNDVVVSAFNAGWTNPNLYNDFLQGSRAIQAGVKKAGVNRLVTIGGAGSLFINGAQLVDSPEFPAEWKPGALAARDYLTELRNEESIDWTFVSPAIEMHAGTSGTRTGKYRTGGESPVFDEKGKSIISAEDLSVAIVDEIENPKHIRQRFTVAY